MSKRTLFEWTIGNAADEDMRAEILDNIAPASTAKPERPANIPRRAFGPEWTAAERAIADAMPPVERAGCDRRLTLALNLLSEAKDRVADFVDGVPYREPSAPVGREPQPKKSGACGAVAPGPDAPMSTRR